MQEKINEELLRCAQINFENLERALPLLKSHSFYIIAKAQLDEALGNKDALIEALNRRTILELDKKL